MGHADELVSYIEAALRHGNLPDQPRVQSVGLVDGEDGTLGVEFADGEMVFIKVQDA